MKTQVYQKEVHFPIFEKILLMGDLFSISIQDIMMHPSQHGFQQISFLDGGEQVGILDIQFESKNVNCNFSFSTPVGELEGTFNNIEEDIQFSLSTKGKPYDAIKGRYQFHLNSKKEIILQGIRCVFQKQNQILYSMNLQKNFVLGFYQNYLRSPKPYENFLLQKKGPIFSYCYQQRGKGCTYALNIEKKSNDIDSFSPPNSTISSFLSKFQERMQFQEINLYQNFISACFSEYEEEFVEQITGIKKSSFQKNKELIHKLHQ